MLAPRPYPLVLSADVLVEDVHFRRSWLGAEALGRRAVAVALSDLAAMGATPTAVLIAASAPAGISSRWLDELLDGCAAAAESEGAHLVGGNLSRAPGVSLAVTVVGEQRGACLTRAGARPGDLLVVSGTLGDAAAAVAAWEAGREPADPLRSRWIDPRPRIRLGVRLAAEGAHAAIDLSDGLAADLGHLCRESGVAAEVWRDRLPRSAEVAALDAAGADFAAAGGEDYELLAACPPAIEHALGGIGRDTGAPLTVIGRCIEGSGLRFAGARERPARGFDHFGPPPETG